MTSAVDEAELKALGAACERHLGDPAKWFVPGGYPDSLALCIIDSIYSTGARYSTVENVVGRYRKYREAQDGAADADGVEELLVTIRELGGPDPWVTRIGNRRPTSTTAGAPLKSVAIAEVGSALAALGIKTAEDLRAAANDERRYEDAKSAWRSVPGQRSGITWDYALMLARVPGVKADRMVIKFVARAIGVEARRLLPRKAAGLVHSVAPSRDWDTIQLDHAIWRLNQGGPFSDPRRVVRPNAATIVRWLQLPTCVSRREYGRDTLRVKRRAGRHGFRTRGHRGVSTGAVELRAGHEVREANGSVFRAGPHAVATVRRRVALDRLARPQGQGRHRD